MSAVDVIVPVSVVFFTPGWIVVDSAPVVGSVSMSHDSAGAACNLGDRFGLTLVVGSVSSFHSASAARSFGDRSENSVMLSCVWCLMFAVLPLVTLVGEQGEAFTHTLRLAIFLTCLQSRLQLQLTFELFTSVVSRHFMEFILIVRLSSSDSANAAAVSANSPISG